jgi:ribosomal protein S2
MADLCVGRRVAHPVMDSQARRASVLRALYVLLRVLQSHGHVLLVNTHPDLVPLLRTLHRDYAHPHLSYCFSTWVGGTLTNWQQFTRSMVSYAGFEAYCAPFVMHRGIAFPRYRRIQRAVHGFLHPTSPRVRFPDMMLLLQVAGNEHILREAARVQVPVCAFVTAATPARGIQYPILHGDLHELRAFCHALVHTARSLRK